MNRKLLGNTVSIGAATLLGIGLWSMPHAYAGNDSFEEVPVTTGLVVNGLNIGFDPKGNNSRSFKVGTAEVTTVLKKDGTVGIKVLKGSLTLTTPTGETLATLTQDDEIELSGFLDNAKMFELLHGSDTQMLRLGAIGTVSISNLGAKPVSFSLGKTAMVVGAKTGRQDAAIGKIFNGPLPKNIMATLKPGVTVIGLDGENKPISITKDLKGNITRKQLDDQSFADQKKRAGNLLQDARKVVPILGVPIKIVLDKTTLEITGTADG
ncbi:MAG TPA: hypothetical protein VL860_09295, partial [Planctomycetota bacterium]|nr:hypothetical protein [Planctomycetota bacterium]